MRRGVGRGSNKDYAHYVAIARGSLMEAETCILLAIRLGYITQSDASSALALITEINRMLNSLRRGLLPPDADR